MVSNAWRWPKVARVLELCEKIPPRPLRPPELWATTNGECGCETAEYNDSGGTILVGSLYPSVEGRLAIVDRSGTLPILLHGALLLADVGAIFLLSHFKAVREYYGDFEQLYLEASLDSLVKLSKEVAGASELTVEERAANSHDRT